MGILADIVSFVIYLLIGAPACLVLHELGHAVMILLLTKQRAVFQFGAQGRRREITMGRLSAVLYVEPSALFFCRYRLEDKRELTRNQDLWITLGGPLSSLLFTVLFGLFWRQSTNGADPWEGLTIINLFNLLVAGIPGHYPRWLTGQGGIANDGLQVVELLGQPRE